MKTRTSLFCGLIVAAAGWAQTQLDLRTQSRNVDFSKSIATKPAKVDTALPPSCGVGEVFFNSSSAPGSNLYLCTSTNIWTLVAGTGSGGGGGGAAVAISTVTVASLPSTCNLGDVRFATDADVTAGGSYIYVCKAPNTWGQFGYIAGAAGALASTCATLPCTIDITAAVPLKTGANAWAGANDFSAASKTAPFQIGAADPIVCDPASREFFFNTTTNTLKSCNAANFWTTIGGSGRQSWTFLPCTGGGPASSPGSLSFGSAGVSFTGPAASAIPVERGCELEIATTGGADRVIYYKFVLPPNYVSGYQVDLLWFSLVTGSGNVVWKNEHVCLTPGVTAATSTTYGAADVRTLPGDVAGKITRTSFNGMGVCAPGDVVEGRLSRLNLGNTYGSSVYLTLLTASWNAN